MANESLHGNDGSLTFTNLSLPTAIHVFKWDGDIQTILHDDSDFDTSDGWEEIIGGMSKMVGTFEARAARASSPTVGMAGTTLGILPVAMTLLLETGKLYTLNAILSNWRTTVVKTDMVLYAASFQSSGAVTVT